MAFPAADATPPRDARRFSATLLAWWRRFARALEAYPVERIGLAALAAGVALRVATPFLMDFRADGDTYTAMGHAWMLHHAFLMPYGDVTTWQPLPPGYSDHYPPAYPFYLGLVFSLFGFGLWQAKMAAVAMSLASLAAVYFCTRDLYGRDRAALLTGLIAVEPHFVWATGTGFSENMVLLFFALTLWAIMRSLTDDRYILLAGLFAGLAYLTRSSVGYFFVIAGVGGLLWRLTFRGWSVLTNRWYVGAIVVFGGILFAWAARNVALFGYSEQTIVGAKIAALGAVGLLILGALLTLPFLVRRPLRTLPNLLPGLALAGAGILLAAWIALWPTSSTLTATWTVSVPNWETSSYVRFVEGFALDRLGDWQEALKDEIPWFILFLAWWVLAFLPESWRGTKKVKQEDTSALWLAVVLVWITAWVITAMFTVYECQSCVKAHQAFFISNEHRYIVIGLLPLGWLLLREARLDRASTRLRVVLLVLSLFCASGAQFVEPVRYADLRAAQFMDPYTRPGDVIGIGYSGTIKYAFYPYLTHPDKLLIYGCGEIYKDPEHADYSLLDNSDSCQTEQANAKYSAAFVLTLTNQSFHGYDWVGTFSQHFSDGGTVPAFLYARSDIVTQRSVPTGVVKEYY